MTDIKQFFTGAAGDLIPRDRWGRPQIKQADGKLKAYQRVTTFVGPLEDTYNLTKWKQRQTMVGLMSRPGLQMAVASNTDNKARLNAIADEAMEAAGSSDKATLGTAIHKFTEAYDNGLDISNMPAAFRPDLDAYIEATKIFKVYAVEQFVVIDELGVAGTTDRIYEYNGKFYIGDVKTGSVEYGIGKICMQLGTYSRGKGYNPDNGERIDLPPVSQTAGIVVHLPAGTGTCELIWVDIASGWDAAKNLAGPVQAWQKRKDLSKPFFPPAPAQVEGQQVLDVPAAPPVTAQPAQQAPQLDPQRSFAEIQAQVQAAREAAGAAVVASRPVAETLPPQNMPGNQAGFDALAGEVNAAILQAINGAIDIHTINVLWELNQTVWTPEHTVAAKARRKELTGGA